MALFIERQLHGESRRATKVIVPEPGSSHMFSISLGGTSSCQSLAFNPSPLRTRFNNMTGFR
jgi:hypothetical protein